MTNLDAALHHAWATVLQILKADPDKLHQRLRLPPSAMYRVHGVNAKNVLEVPALNRESAAVEITADLLRSLNRPVHLPSPGLDVQDAAKLLGRTRAAFTTARITGQFRTHHHPGLSGKHGPPIPLIHTPLSLDPCAGHTAAPAAHSPFPSVWDFGLPILPPNFSQHLIRVPIYHPVHFRDPDKTETRTRKLPPPEPDPVWYKWKGDEYIGYDWRNPKAAAAYHRHQRKLSLARAADKRRRRENPPPRSSEGSLHFVGWNFLCPACKKPARILYLPLPPINLHRMLQSLEIPANWLRELEETSSTPAPALACHRCHNIQFTATSKNAWNQLITHLSRGWLFGHEVPKPDEWTNPHRKRKYRPRITKSPRRQAVLRRLLNGWTAKQIAIDLQMHYVAVWQNIKTLCQMERVKNRTELAQKLGSKIPQPLTHQERAAQNRDQILPLYLQGLTFKEISAQTNLPIHTITRAIHWYHIQHQITGPPRARRKALVKKLGHPEPRPLSRTGVVT